MDIRYFDQLESTNNYCKLLNPDSVEEFTVIVARSQTAGIGQQGNRWESQPGQNLTFSVILKPAFLEAARQFRLTMALSLAIARFVERTLSAARTAEPLPPVSIKWPNDIYVGDLKICGTLISCSLQGDRIAHAVCGIGLNVNQTRFPDWVPNPTSLKLLTGAHYPLDSTLGDLLRLLETYYPRSRSNDAALEEEYLRLLYRRGQKARYEYLGTPLEATVTGVDPHGRLLLQPADGSPLLTCSMKEVRFLP